LFITFFFFAGYAQEKTLEQVGKFDKNCLKHVDTQEKNPLPSQAGKKSLV